MLRNESTELYIVIAAIYLVILSALQLNSVL